ncbi:MAG: ATP-dependent DNA helicase [bacterium]
MYTLNQNQKKAVEYTDGPLIIVAGAGTGKTTVITRKIAHLIEKNIAKSENILALAFNDKAAEEIEERVDQLVDIGYVDMQISTFHSFCQRLLEEYGLDIGLSDNFKLLSQTDAWILIRKNLDKFNLDYYRPLGNPSKHIHEFIKHFSKCKDELIAPQEYLEYAENIKLDKDNMNGYEKDRLTEVANAYHTYNQILLDNNSLDFGDLIYYAVKLLEKRPKILKLLKNKFKCILVDEFQDVNWAQYELVRLLSDKQSQLTVVGDDDQSIYAFRGASVSNIMRFKDDYPKAKEIILTQNYRSGQEILEKAYISIQNNNPDRLEVKLKIDKKLKAVDQAKSEIIHSHNSSLEDEVKFVINEIAKLKELDSEASWDDFAILVRANNHANAFISGFEAVQIPYEFLASSGLYRQPIVLDCLNYFKLLDDYHELHALYRVLQIPAWKIKENDLQKITYTARRKSISYYETIKRSREFGLSENGIELCEKTLNLIHDGMKKARNEKPHKILYDFLEKSGYLKYLAHEEERSNRSVIRQIYQLMQFFEYLKKYEENVPDARIYDFMSQFQYLVESGDEGGLYQPKDTPDSINIITIHKAKGLEFKYVFVVNMVEDRFPTRRRGNGIEIPLELIKEDLPEGDSHFQEERRLFYVACTRAKQKLYFTSSSNYGGIRKKKISRFLNELGYQITDNKVKEKDIKISIQKEQKNDGIIFYQIPKVFSFSQIKSYNTCPYQYKLGAIIKLPSKQSHYFSFGNTIHGAMLEFYKRIQQLNSSKQESIFSSIQGIDRSGHSKDGAIKAPALDELIKIYEEKWQDDWYLSREQREKYFIDGKKMLKNYYESNCEKWTVPVCLESGFKIKIDDFLFNGKIDRIDQNKNGGLIVIDYKTGASKEKAKGDEKDQLITYQMAMSQLQQYNNIGKVEQLILYYVKDGQQTAFMATEKEIINIKTKIANTVNKIKSFEFDANPSKHICANCHYRDICEFRI